MENVAPRGERGPVPGRAQARRRQSGPPAQVRPTRPTRPAGAGPAHQAHQARRRRSGPPDRCLGLCFSFPEYREILLPTLYSIY